MTNIAGRALPDLTGMILLNSPEEVKRTVTQDQPLASIENGTAPVIVDVPSQWEYELEHVTGAQHLPFFPLIRSRRGVNVR